MVWRSKCWNEPQFFAPCSVGSCSPFRLTSFSMVMARFFISRGGEEVSLSMSRKTECRGEIRRCSFLCSSDRRCGGDRC